MYENSSSCRAISLGENLHADGAGTRPPHSADRKSGNGAPAEHVGRHSGVDVGAGCDQQSDDSAIAVLRRIVQRGPVIAVHGGAGVRGWAPRRCPSPQTGTRTQNSTQAPRVDRVSVLGRPLTERVLGADSEYSPSRSRSRSHQPCEPSERTSRKRRLRAKEAARNREIRQCGRGAYRSQNVAS
jgi:hypothetical protein